MSAAEGTGAPVWGGGGAVRVTVPASSANLGPGFDACALALALYDEVTVAAARSGLTVALDGVGAGDVPLDGRHLVVRSMRATFDALGLPQPGLALRCRNQIPHSRGLGSSAAAIVAGVSAADALACGAHGGAGLGADGVLRLAAEIEGHPDNVAAAVLGGFTVAWCDAAGAHAVRAEPSAELRPVAFVPAARQSTAASRAALPDRVAHADAALTAGRAALLAIAVTGRIPGPAAGSGGAAGSSGADLLFAATEDRLHEPYRLAAAPATRELVGRLRRAGIAAVLSGSGPTVLALATSAEQAAASAAAVDAGFSVLPLAVDPGGVRVQRLAGDGR